MVVAVADVVAALNGVVVLPASFSFFGHTVTSAFIQSIITRRTNFYTVAPDPYFTDSIIADAPAKVDEVILLDSCMRVLMQGVMGVLMQSGVSYSTLKLTMNKSNFPDIVKNAVDGFASELKSLINQLTVSGDTFASMDLGPGKYTGLDEYDQDSMPDFVESNPNYQY